MRGRRCSFVLLALASLAGCGASCKKDADSASADDVAIVDLPNVDTSTLIVSEKKVFSKVVHEFMSPCGDPFTLETCVRENRPCSKCLPAARIVAQLVPMGEADASIKAYLTQRFDDRWAFNIDPGPSPTLGPSSAPITMVEFADFECPHCKAMSPLLHSLVESDTFNDAPNEFKGKIRFVFKTFPLGIHEHAEPAARASIAAQKQGKFWEMHDQLFAHQENLNPSDLEAYARKIGLDVDKWRDDMNSQEVKDRVAADRKYGEMMDPEGHAIVTGTPAIFIDGRKMNFTARPDLPTQLRDWLRLELQLLGATPVPPSTSASTPPAPSVSASTSASATGSK